MHPWEIVVSDLMGRELARATCEVRVAQCNAGQGKHLRLLIVGDSLTHATWYSNRLSDLCEQPGNPQLEMMGTHKPNWRKPGVAHEGYNGWTWAHFLRHYTPGECLNGTPDKSPFLFVVSAGGKPKFDLPRYLRETCPAGLPDLVIFQLGINDVFSQLPYEGYLFSPDEDRLTPNIDQLLQEFRAAAPQASLAIWLTQPVNATQESFEASYRGLEDYRGIQRNKMALRQHWIADQILHRYGGRESEGLFLIPMSATVDPLDDFSASDSVHPSIPGYEPHRRRRLRLAQMVAERCVERRRTVGTGVAARCGCEGRNREEIIARFGSATSASSPRRYAAASPGVRAGLRWS